MLTDYHVHTRPSDDCVYPLEDVAKDAIGLRLDEICITNHVDYGIIALKPVFTRRGNDMRSVPNGEKVVEGMRGISNISQKLLRQQWGWHR